MLFLALKQQLEQRDPFLATASAEDFNTIYDPEEFGRRLVQTRQKKTIQAMKAAGAFMKRKSKDDWTKKKKRSRWDLEEVESTNLDVRLGRREKTFIQ